MPQLAPSSPYSRFASSATARSVRARRLPSQLAYWQHLDGESTSRLECATSAPTGQQAATRAPTPRFAFFVLVGGRILGSARTAGGVRDAAAMPGVRR